MRAFWILLGPALFLAVELFFHPNVAGLTDADGAPLSAHLVRHALAVTLWIAAWWFTEAIPIPATSLLPLVLLPVLGLGSAADVSRQYGHEIIFLFLGGFLLALAMERTGLHRRVALTIIGLFGHGRRGLVFGFMLATAVMSMWISNTATTVMLLPVALAILATEERADERGVDAPYALALLLGIAFAANIGGLGTPVGSPPNIIFQKVYAQKTGGEVGFLRWMLFGLPAVAVLLPVTWWFLTRKLQSGAPGDVELPTCGRMTWGEWWVFGIFSVTVVLWISRGSLGSWEGWGKLLAAEGIVLKDSTVAIAASLLLFIVPRRPPGPSADEEDAGGILDWSVAPRLPWGVLLLMGAGFALSGAFDEGGLTVWIGAQLEGLGALQLPPFLLLALVLGAVVVTSIVVTEFASNTASANILLPVIFTVSAALGPERFPPEILMVSCALGCTTGFAVPAGTPPNALVFATERISIGRFVRTGLWIDLLSAVIIVAIGLVAASAG